MTRAIVIKMHGDAEIAAAIADGMTQRVIPLNDEEYAALRAELARLRAKDALRSYGDERRLETACRALTVKYPPERHGRLYGAVLGAWAYVWLMIDGAYRYLSAWNRGA